MASETALRLKQERGARAKALLDNDLLNEAWDRLEADLNQAFRDSRDGDSDLRERIWVSIKLLRNQKDYIKKMVTEGEAASKQLLKTTTPIFGR